MAITALQTPGAAPTARVEAIASMSSRLRVMPCWKITTGQPVPGIAQTAGNGIAISTGMTFAVVVGLGVKLLTSVEFKAVSVPLALCQESVRAVVAPLAGTVR